MTARAAALSTYWSHPFRYASHPASPKFRLGSKMTTSLSWMRKSHGATVKPLAPSTAKALASAHDSYT
jgi:hypothetical protein